MGKKIKITEEQLKYLLDKKKDMKEELDIEELGGAFHLNNKGGYEEGEGPMPEPAEMADIVAKQIKLHPDYFKSENAGALEEFFDYLREMLTVDNESDQLFPDAASEKFLKVTDDQLNESVEKIKSEFKRFL